MGKGRGPLRLERELSEKGISAEIVKSCLDAHFGDGGESRAAMIHVEKLLKQQGHLQSVFNDEEEHELETEPREGEAHPLLDEKELAKIGRRLAYQGYHSHVIYGIIDRLRI